MYTTYNQMISRINTDNIEPITCDCSNSKVCYAPAGNVITGDLNDVTDRRLRKLIYCPKFRLPVPIYFKSCCRDIAKVINTYYYKWCKCDNRDPNALSSWNKSVFSIIDTRIQFYQSNPSLVPGPPLHSSRIKRSIQVFHSKYVIVPADNAANTTLIV